MLVLALLLAPGLLVSATALAEVDAPVSTETVPPKSASDLVGEIRCTYFADLMVRETNTASPWPGPSRIVPVTGGHPACAAAAGVVVKAEGFYFAGRRGPFLLFSASDPLGAAAFFVVTAAGREVYRDSVMDRLHTMVLEDGQLRITFLRGLNAPCSIVKDGQACWARISREQYLPPAVSKLPPPVQACAAAYGGDNTPAYNFSVITYEVDLRVDTAGKTTTLSRGPLGCLPLP